MKFKIQTKEDNLGNIFEGREQHSRSVRTEEFPRLKLDQLDPEIN